MEKIGYKLEKIQVSGGILLYLYAKEILQHVVWFRQHRKTQKVSVRVRG